MLFPFFLALKYVLAIRQIGRKASAATAIKEAIITLFKWFYCSSFNFWGLRCFTVRLNVNVLVVVAVAVAVLKHKAAAKLLLLLFLLPTLQNWITIELLMMKQKKKQRKTKIMRQKTEEKNCINWIELNWIFVKNVQIF